LRSIGIQPDILVCRSEQPLPKEQRKKIALFTNVPEKAVISAYDVDDLEGKLLDTSLSVIGQTIGVHPGLDLFHTDIALRIEVGSGVLGLCGRAECQ